MKTMQEVIQYLEEAGIKQATAALLQQSRRSPDAAPFPPHSLRQQLTVTHQFFDHRPAFRLSPPHPTLRVLYFHGGAYYNEFAPAHWRLIRRMAQELNAEVIAPDYPLTPVYGHRDVFSMVTQVYRACLQELPAGGLVLAGDSAGGGIALALTQWALQQGLPLPRRLALLSPWVDLTVSTPEQAALDAVDPFLEVESGRRLGELYAQGDDLHHYQVSPLFGPMEGLPPTVIFSGTRDILYADATALHRRMLQSHVPCTLSVGEGMIHTWMLFPVQEAVVPLQELMEFLQG